MLYLDNYWSEFMCLLVMMCINIIILNIVYQDFQFPISFQDTSLCLFKFINEFHN